MSNKTLKFCGDNSYPPFEFVNDNGLFRGFNVDLLRAMGKDLDIVIEFTPMSWNEAIEQVSQGCFDAIQGMVVSPKRKEFLSFSDDYFVISQCIFVAKKNIKVSCLEDLKELRVAIQKGDYAYELINHNNNKPVPSLHYILFEDQEKAFHELIKGEVDAFIGNHLTGSYIAKKLGKEKEIRIVGEPIANKKYAIAVLKERTDLLELLNAGIASLKSNGTYDNLCVKWFGRISSDVENQIIDTVSAGIIGLNKLGTVISINSYAKKFFDFEISPLRKHYSYVEQFPFINPSLLFKTMTEGQAFFDLEFSFHKKEMEYSMSYNLCPLYDLDSEIMGAVITFRDITEEKKLKQSIITNDKMQSLGSLISSIAHEIRNPLTSIKTFVDVLPEQFENPEYRKAILHHVPNEINRLNNLLTDLLEYSRPRSALQKNCNLRELLNSVFDLFAYKRELKREFLNLVPGDIVVFADEQQLKQIFINLILNAIEATTETGKVIISAVQEKEVRVKVQDNGIGITAVDLQKIFDPFYTTKEKGTGLGLYIVYQLLKENQASISLINLDTQGTCFELTFKAGVESNG